MDREIVLITGASRGIGRALAIELGSKGYQVLVSARNKAGALETVNIIRQEDGIAEAFELDVSMDTSIQQLARDLKERFGKIDILVNNAGIFDSKHDSILTVPEEALIASLKTNAFGPLKLVQNLHPLLAKSSNPRVINVSSGMGGLSEMGSGSPAYRLSKTALNVFTILLSHELADKGIRVNSICPGWVQTDMGGAGATRILKEGIGSITAIINTPKDGPNGGFFRDGTPIPW